MTNRDTTTFSMPPSLLPGAKASIATAPGTCVPYGSAVATHQRATNRELRKATCSRTKALTGIGGSGCVSLERRADLDAPALATLSDTCADMKGIGKRRRIMRNRNHRATNANARKTRHTAQLDEHMLKRIEHTTPHSYQLMKLQ